MQSNREVDNMPIDNGYIASKKREDLKMGENITGQENNACDDHVLYHCVSNLCVYKTAEAADAALVAERAAA